MSDAVNNSSKKDDLVYVFVPFGDANVEIMRQCESSKFDRNSKTWKINKENLAQANPAIKDFVIFDNYSDTMKYRMAILHNDEKKQEEVKKNSLQNTNEELFSQIGKVFDSVKAEKLASDRKSASEEYKEEHKNDIMINFILPKKDEIGEEQYNTYLKAFQSSNMHHLINNGNHIYQCDQNVLPYIHPALKDLPMYNTPNVLLASSKSKADRAKTISADELGLKEEIGNKYNAEAGLKRYEKKIEHNKQIEEFKAVKKQKYVDRMQRVYVKYSDYAKKVIGGLRDKFRDPQDSNKDFANIFYDKASKCTVIPKRVLRDCPQELRDAFIHCTVYGTKVRAIERKEPLNQLAKQFMSENSDVRQRVIEKYNELYKEQKDNCKNGEKPTISLLDIYAQTINLKSEMEYSQNADNSADFELLDPSDHDEVGLLGDESIKDYVDYVNAQGDLAEERGISEDDLDLDLSDEQGQGR